MSLSKTVSPCSSRSRPSEVKTKGRPCSSTSGARRHLFQFGRPRRGLAKSGVDIRENLAEHRHRAFREVGHPTVGPAVVAPKKAETGEGMLRA